MNQLKQIITEDLNNLNVDIGGVIVDVEQVTEENGVNPYALKVALEEGLNAEEASPFSSLATRIPNTQASDSAEYSLTKSVISTKVNKTDQDGTAYVAKSGALTSQWKNTNSRHVCNAYQCNYKNWEYNKYES